MKREEGSEQSRQEQEGRGQSMGIFMRCTEPTHCTVRSRCFLISLTTLPHFPLAPQSGLALSAAFGKSSFWLRRTRLPFSIVVVVERKNLGSYFSVFASSPENHYKRRFMPFTHLCNAIFWPTAPVRPASRAQPCGHTPDQVFPSKLRHLSSLGH